MTSREGGEAMTDQRAIRFPGAADGAPMGSRLPLEGGGEIEVATWGPSPDGTATILLLHEGLGCVMLWRDFPSRLAEATGCGVVAYSRLGYGASSSIVPPLPVDHMAREAQSVIPQLLAAIAPQKLALIGHSDGATIAAHYLAGEPDARVDRAVLIAPHFFVEDTNLAAIRATRDAFEKGDLRGRLAKYHGANVDGAFYAFAETWLAPAFRSWDMRAEIPRWRHPVLFIQGNDDPYGSEAQATAAGRSPHCRVVNLDGCAHAPHLEAPDVTLAVIVDFLARGAPP